MLKIFESHAHYDDAAFDEDRDTLLRNMPMEGIHRVINISADADSLDKIFNLTRDYSHVYGTLGIHPSEIADLEADWQTVFDKIRRYSQSPKIVGIGEIGLDYYWEKDKNIQKRQQEWFIRQLSLADELNLPVVIHSRDASQDTFDILEEYGPRRKGIIHCYSGSAQMAVEYAKRGYMIGVGGVVTFKNARSIKETVEEIDLESIVVETDAPYLSPEPYRGKRNTSYMLPYIIQEIAKIKGVDPQVVSEITYANGMRIFGLE